MEEVAGEGVGDSPSAEPSHHNLRETSFLKIPAITAAMACKGGAYTDLLLPPQRGLLELVGKAETDKTRLWPAAPAKKTEERASKEVGRRVSYSKEKLDEYSIFFSWK